MRSVLGRWAAKILLAVCLMGLLPGQGYALNADGQEPVRVAWFEDSYNITGAHGERSGYGYEYQQSVAAYTGWTYEYVKGGWSDLLKQLQAGEIDLMSGVSYTEERAETMLFSDRPMGEERYLLYADVAHTDISAANLETLNGKRVGLLEGSIHATQFYQWEKNHGLQLEHVFVTGLEDAAEKVANREIDCLVSAKTPQLVELGLSAVVTVGGSDIYFVINQNRPDLKTALDGAMRAISYDKPFYSNTLYQRYFSTASSEVLNNDEQAWLTEHGAIRIGYLNHDAGVSEQNVENGKIFGVLTDYVNFAETCLSNQTLSFQLVGFDSLEEQTRALKDGRIDMIFHFSQNPYVAEENGFVLSNPVFSEKMAAVTAQMYFDESAENIVAIQKGDPLLEWSLSYNYPAWTITEYDSLREVEQAVRSGEADCLIADYENLPGYIEDSRLYPVYLTQPDDSAFAVSLGDTTLVSILNKTLRTMPSSMLTGALSMYHNATRKTSLTVFVKENLLMISLDVGLVFVLILIFLRKSRKSEAKAKQAAAQTLELNRQLKESQSDLQAALVRAERANSAKTVFLSNMSHDIRTPMNAIVGLTSLIQHDRKDPEKLNAYIRKIQSSSQHLLSLLNDILDMSKIESSEVALSHAPMNLAEQVGQVDSMIRPMAEERGQHFAIRVHEIVHESLIGDAVRLRQVIINLLSNALKYTPSGRSIRFDIAELPCENDGYARIRFTVTDTGYGMTPEFQQHIFEPFTRAENSTTNKVQGTGLGMAITKNIVDLMGGTIDVQSKINRGSCFRVTAPILIDPNAKQEIEARNVLLITKEETLIRNARASFLESGAEIHVARTKDEALAVLKAQSIDTVLLSGYLQSPQLPAIVQLLHREAKDSVLVFCVDYTQQEQVSELLRQSGINGLITRPFFLSNFAHAVNQARNEVPQVEKKTDTVLKGLRLLCAEDNALNAEILFAVLDMNGASCKICPDGKQLVEAFEASKPGEYDAILMDVQMPVMNGLEATRAIRRGNNPLGRTIPIVAMTANVFSSDVQECLDAGMNAHMSKPLDAAVLERTLRSVLDGKFSGGGTSVCRERTTSL